MTEQRLAALKRLRDAKALLEKSVSESGSSTKGPYTCAAMYLGGYAIECKIKAIAMEVHGCRTLATLVSKLHVSDDEVYSHGLEALLMRLLPSLYARLRSSPVWRDFAGPVNTWRPSWRYDGRDRYNEAGTTFIKAVDRVYHWLVSHQC